MINVPDPDDTIAAVASPPGPGYRGLVRLSGPEAWPIARSGFAVVGEWVPPVRAEVRAGRLKVDGLTRALTATIGFWPGPRTYTGQPLAEIHTVGSPPLVNLVLAQCLRRGARQAEPGEFTLRAFLSGRLDLTRAEAVLGVIDARSQAQLDAALQQLAGGLARPIVTLRDRLLDGLAHLEAGLDFVEEADVDPLGREALRLELSEAAAVVAELSGRLHRRERSEGRPRVVLVGPPNAGKSQLFNRLVGESLALVSPSAGTTRDYNSAHWLCDGLAVELIDTAGIDRPSSPIEASAQSLRASQAACADLLLLCESADTLRGRSPFDLPTDRPVLRVWTKCDLGPPEPDTAEFPCLPTSAETGEGVSVLRSAIAEALRRESADSDLPSTTGARCRGSLLRARDALLSAADTLALGGGDELVVIDLRVAADELGKVVGAVFTDDILDRIFRRFCIGK